MRTLVALFLVTAAAIAAARPPFAITHAPGRMLVTDLQNAQLAVHGERKEELS